MYYYLANYWEIALMIAVAIIAAVSCAAALERNKSTNDDGDYDEGDDDDGYYDEGDDDDDGDYDEGDDEDEEPSGAIIVMEWEAKKDPDADSSAPSAAILAGARYIVVNIDDSTNVMDWMSTYAARLGIELSDKMSARGYKISSIYSYAMSLEDYDKIAEG